MKTFCCTCLFLSLTGGCCSESSEDRCCRSRESQAPGCLDAWALGRLSAGFMLLNSGISSQGPQEFIVRGLLNNQQNLTRHINNLTHCRSSAGLRQALRTTASLFADESLFRFFVFQFFLSRLSIGCTSPTMLFYPWGTCRCCPIVDGACRREIITSVTSCAPYNAERVSLQTPRAEEVVCEISSLVRCL